MDVPAIGAGAGGLAVVLFSAIALIRYLLSDKSVAYTHEEQIRELRRDVAELRGQVSVLLADNELQHRLKHDAVGRATFAEGTLDLVRRYVPACTCGALDVLMPLLERRHEPREGEPT